MISDPAWEDGAWGALPALDGDVDADACVVGLGGSGLACIGELLSLDQRVVGLDARTVASGAAGRNGGFLLAGLPAFYHDAVVRFGHDRVLALYQRTMREFDRMEAETPALVRRTGSLRIAIDAAELQDCEAQLDAMQRDRLPAERYQGPEGRGILLPTDGTFNPLARCRQLARGVTARGARLYEQSPVVDIEAGRVSTAAGTVRASTIIVAIDGCLEQVLPELRGRVRAARLQMLATEPLADVRFPRPVYQRWGYEYWQQLPDRSIVLGGLRDRAGPGEWTDQPSPTDTLQGELDQVLRGRLHVDVAVRRRWAGVVGYTDDGWPVVAQPRPGVWAVGGYSGTGNILGALCGRGVAQLAVTGASELLQELQR